MIVCVCRGFFSNHLFMEGVFIKMQMISSQLLVLTTSNSSLFEGSWQGNPWELYSSGVQDTHDRLFFMNVTGDGVVRWHWTHAKIQKALICATLGPKTTTGLGVTLQSHVRSDDFSAFILWKWLQCMKSNEMLCCVTLKTLWNRRKY